MKQTILQLPKLLSADNLSKMERLGTEHQRGQIVILFFNIWPLAIMKIFPIMS